MKTQDYEIRVAGVTFANRQNLLAGLQRTKKPIGFSLWREKTNKADPNAIKIMAYIGTPEEGQKSFPIGYVPKDVAAELAPVMDAKTWVSIVGYRFTGGHGLTRGLCLTLRLEVRELAMAYERA